jgi:GNAT superfamily N-acetyltransferase
MVLQSLTIGGARFRAGSWRASSDLAYLVPLSPAHTLTAPALAEARATLEARGFDQVVTAAVAPPERAAFLRDGFVEREHLHLLRHDLKGLPRGARRWPRRHPTIGIERGTSADRDEILALDSRTFDDFWRLDGDGLDDALDATPVSRLRVVRDPEIVGYTVAGRAGSQGFLQRLAVDPGHQGGGLGTALVHDALRWMRRRSAQVGWVNTQEANERALSLYEHLGFQPAGHDLTVMARSLS